MRYIKGLSKETLKLLKRIYKQSKHFQVRQRSHCIQLSYEGYKISQLMKIFKVSRNTIYNWFNDWDKHRLVGLYDRAGRGRKKSFDIEQQEQIKHWVKETPKNLGKVQEKIQEKWGITTSKYTIKRIIKKLEMTWKRMKRGVAKTPDEWELEVKLPKLVELKDKEEKAEIDLRYFDESGFSLTPYIPYAWQEKRQQIILKSSKSKRINVLGLMNRNLQLDYEIHSETINSETVINFFDKFSANLEKHTVVVCDRASIHTSDALLDKLPEWEQKKLEIFWLPTYSPKLNLIEMLWKFIKYEWIEVDAYDSRKALMNYLKKVLDHLGSKYTINFA